MNWEKLKKAIIPLKKVIIPLFIVKLIIFVFLLFKGDVISISRDLNYSSNYQEISDCDSMVVKKQKFIRIVRNEDNRGISIKFRGRKNDIPLREKGGEIPVPIVD
ncbi:MAG: hypothetical protein IPN67_03630 [Bacteroidales bacterium]|nr:hypothetical protein [Bacteroidales bacterium]